jgi:hypothetical protein
MNEIKSVTKSITVDGRSANYRHLVGDYYDKQTNEKRLVRALRKVIGQKIYGLSIWGDKYGKTINGTFSVYGKFVTSDGGRR